MACPDVFYSDDGQILRAMQRASHNGGLITRHAENGIAKRRLMPGAESRMDLLHQAVVDGHISRRRWIEIACASPARMFGLYPKKGTIAPDADADIVIYDPAAEQTISAETPHMNVDDSAYEGKRVTGQVDTVVSRGEAVVDGRKFTGRAGHGMYTPRATCQYLD